MSLLVKNHALKAKDAYDEKIKKGNSQDIILYVHSLHASIMKQTLKFKCSFSGQTPNKPKFMQQANDNSNSSTLCTEKSPKNSQESIPQMTESLGDDDEGNPFQDLDNFLDSHRAGEQTFKVWVRIMTIDFQCVINIIVVVASNCFLFLR